MAIRSKQSVTGMIVVCIVALFAVTEAGIDISQINVNDLQQQLPGDLNNTNFTLDDAKTLVRDKCIKVAGEEEGKHAFEEIELAAGTLFECVTGIVNFTAIQAEIEEASPRGELDVVFNKYCLKRPEALDCIESFNSKLVPCLDQDERKHQDVFMHIVRSLLNFVCHKGGDQIALFIAEKGPECLESKKDDIVQCINNTFSGYIPQDGFENVKELPKFTISQKQCDDFLLLETCVVDKLEKCSEITPANIVESMFRFIKNETICRTSNSMPAKQLGSKNAADSNRISLITSISAVITLFFFLLAKRLQL